MTSDYYALLIDVNTCERLLGHSRPPGGHTRYPERRQGGELDILIEAIEGDLARDKRIAERDIQYGRIHK